MWNRKPNVKRHKIKSHTPEWYAFRANGMGSSEIGGIMGYNKWQPPIVVYHQKVGDFPSETRDNEPMFHGRGLEDYIAKCWSFYGDSVESMIENQKNHRIIRKPTYVSGYFTNKKYPYLFSSPDRMFSGFRLDTYEEITEGILECKMISHWESQKWESGIPPSYIFQVQQQMMVLEINYAEICALHNGNQIRIYPLEFSEKIGAMIEEETTKFWNRVMPAKEAWAKFQSGFMTEEYAQTIIQKHEPDADGSEKTMELLSLKYQKIYEDTVANDTDENVAQELRTVKAKMKELEAMKDQFENYFRQRFVNEKVERMLMSSGEFIKASKRANAQKLTITV
jgi:putative phage-type endonuclease